MIEAEALALGTAHQLNERSGTEVAVLGLEASQQAWQAYRDVECQTLGVFAGEVRRCAAAPLAIKLRLHPFGFDPPPPALSFRRRWPA